MLKLSEISDSVMQVAEAITAALEIETEIVDRDLQIIAGTGRYKNKIGTYEEEGNLDSGLLYARLLNKGDVYICEDCPSDFEYNGLEGELAEISCPILLEGTVLGLIGLVAFTEKQQDIIKQKKDTLLVFLQRMAELIASKLVAEEHAKVLESKLNSFVTSLQADTSFDDITGASRAINIAKKRAMHVAYSDSTVLITGESGTGKELFSRAIHFTSPRQKYPFVSINCGAIPDMLLESELFGYEAGAFTNAGKDGKPGKFETADKGTIFLDEIGDLPLHMQVKLLHAIQNRQIERIGGISPIDIDVRIITATNKDLEEMIYKGEFREDLYFRLNVIPLNIPPLREREGDIELLLEYALRKFSTMLNKDIIGFSDKALNFLCSYNWPGNVRELENTVEYAVNMTDSYIIETTNLPERILRDSIGFHGMTSLKEQTDQLQKRIIERCLRETGASLEGKREAAKRLCISESTLYRRIRELSIE